MKAFNTSGMGQHQLHHTRASLLNFIMRTPQEKIILASVLLALIYVIQVEAVPVPDSWKGLLQRTRRSLLWRWNSMKPVGASCREHLECGTKYCRRKICSFYIGS